MSKFARSKSPDSINLAEPLQESFSGERILRLRLKASCSLDDEGNPIVDIVVPAHNFPPHFIESLEHFDLSESQVSEALDLIQELTTLNYLRKSQVRSR